MFWDEQKILANIAAADTDDLLDRVTAFRAGVEVEVVGMIEKELRDRGISQIQIVEREELCRRECIYFPDGSAAKCSLCAKPAVAEGWNWHKLWGVIPVLPRYFRYCREHIV